MFLPEGPCADFPSGKRRKTGGEKRRDGNALPQTLYIFAYEHKMLQVFGFATLATVQLLSRNWQEDSFERQRGHFGGAVDHVVWRLQDVHLFAEPVVLQYPADLSHLGTVVAPCQTPRIRQLMRDNNQDWTKFLRMPLVWCRELVQTQQFMVTSTKYCLALGIPEPVDYFEPPRQTASNVSASMTWAQVVEQKAFKPDVVLKCWRLLQMLRSSQDGMGEVVQLALKIVLPPDMLPSLASLPRLPSGTTMQNVEHRLNLVDLLWQRELHSRYHFARHWMPDASPQGGYHYVCVVEARWQFARHASVAELATIDIDKHFVMRHLPLVTLGHGRQDVLYKSLCLHHMLALETGSYKTFCKARAEVRTYTSDQGVEQNIVDSPLLYSEGFANAERLRELFSSGIERNTEVTSHRWFRLLCPSGRAGRSQLETNTWWVVCIVPRNVGGQCDLAVYIGGILLAVLFGFSGLSARLLQRFGGGGHHVTGVGHARNSFQVDCVHVQQPRHSVLFH
jgi:hypothetical protein